MNSKSPKFEIGEMVLISLIGSGWSGTTLKIARQVNHGLWVCEFIEKNPYLMKSPYWSLQTKCTLPGSWLESLDINKQYAEAF